MMRPGMAISALVLTLGVIQPGHAAAVHAGAAVKADTQAVTGDHIVKAKSRHRLRSGHSFRHRRFGGHRRFGRHRGGFRHGRRHGRTRFSLSLAFPFAYFVLGPHGHHRYYRGLGFHYGRHGSRFGHYRYLGWCREVTKYGFDRFGRRAKIGGTLCFDRSTRTSHHGQVRHGGYRTTG